MGGQDVLGLLSTLASIAAALVGFSGLLTALRARSDDLTANDVTNIRILLLFSVAALVFALLPLLALTFGRPEWMRAMTIGLGAFLAVWMVQSPLWMRRTGVRPRNPRLFWSVLVAQAVLGVLLVAATMAGHAPAPYYVAGVLWCIGTATLVFVVQVFAMLPVRDERTRS